MEPRDGALLGEWGPTWVSLSLGRLEREALFEASAG